MLPLLTSTFVWPICMTKQVTFTTILLLTTTNYQESIDTRASLGWHRTLRADLL